MFEAPPLTVAQLTARYATDAANAARVASEKADVAARYAESLAAQIERKETEKKTLKNASESKPKRARVQKEQ